MGLKDLIKIRENYRYMILVVWLLVGISFMPFSQITSVIGVFILLPLVVFLLFLFLLSIFSKKHVEEYKDKWIIIGLFISLPFMLIISVILVVLFVLSIFMYFFISSWFIIYGCYLSSKYFDEKLEERKYSGFTRSVEFLGGAFLSFLLLVVFLVGSVYYTIVAINIPIFLNAVYIVVWVVLFALGIRALGYLLERIFNAWLGLFYILIIGYTFFLVLKVFLGLASVGDDSTKPLYLKILLVLGDIVLILYSVSTLMGTQAELLSQKLKYIGADTVFFGLLFSKVSYEFAVNFPYYLLKEIPFLANIPYIEYIISIGSELSLLRNIAVLCFFIVLLIIVGFSQMRQYAKTKRMILEKEKVVEEGVTEIVEAKEVEEGQLIDMEERKFEEEVKKPDEEIEEEEEETEKVIVQEVGKDSILVKKVEDADEPREEVDEQETNDQKNED